MFASLKRRRARAEIAARLHQALVAQARAPALYGPGRVPDTVEGRFEAITLHVALVLRRLRDEADPLAGALAQSLFDVLIDDLDAGLREIGVGDLVVGKKMRKMGAAFYGRAKAYDAALVSDEPQALTLALRRNLFVDADPDAATLEAARDYVRTLAKLLSETSIEVFLSGEVPDPPAFGA